MNGHNVWRFVVALLLAGSALVVSSSSAAVTPQVSAGGFHTCALTEDGALVCWGRDDFLQVSNAPPTLIVPPSDFTFSGFFAPVSNEDLNRVKAGQAVPVKFSLGGDHGLEIFASTYPQSRPIDCDASEDINPITETVTAGGSSLSYDTDLDQYTYVWKTERAWANSCRRLTLEFTDGSRATVDFWFTK